MNLRCTFLAGVMVALLPLPATGQPGPVLITGPSEPVPLHYFGLHIHRAVPTKRFPQPSVWPTITFGEWRLLNALVSWPQIEPKPAQATMVDMASPPRQCPMKA